MKRILLLLPLLISCSAVSWAGGQITPLTQFNLIAPTCSLLTPNIQPPNCVDYNHVFVRAPICSTANPQIVPPNCSAIDEPNASLSPGSTFNLTLSQICASGYLATVPAVSTISNGTIQQAYVNYGFPFKGTTGPCLGGCTTQRVIPAGLGGDNTLANIWPQPTTGDGTWTVAARDTLVATLRERVCYLSPNSYQAVKLTTIVAGTDATNLVSDTTYIATITVGTTPISISISGVSAQTFTTLLVQLNLALGSNAVATLDIPNTRIVIAATNPTTPISINSGTLFASPLSQFSGLTVPMRGHSTQLDILTARGVMSGNWKGAYTSFVTNNQ